MKTLDLTKGRFALVDDEDYEVLSKYKWYAATSHGHWYAVRGVIINGKNGKVLMHRQILNPPESMDVDHRDANGLNNCKVNLRIATRSQNTQNGKRRVNNTSGHIGVSWSKKSRKWHSQIQIDGKRVHLGFFDNIESASTAYKASARSHFGEFYKPS